jgi:hypothetical protein
MGTSMEFNSEIAGLNPPDLDWESYSGAHRVAPGSTSELKAQAEAKFHMY